MATTGDTTYTWWENSSGGIGAQYVFDYALTFSDLKSIYSNNQCINFHNFCKVLQQFAESFID